MRAWQGQGVPEQIGHGGEQGKCSGSPGDPGHAASEVLSRGLPVSQWDPQPHWNERTVPRGPGRWLLCLSETHGRFRAAGRSLVLGPGGSYIILTLG